MLGPSEQSEQIFCLHFETDEGERDKARTLYERLLALSGHVKVWISYALFEATPLPLPRAERDDDEDQSGEVSMVPGDLSLARQVFERGYKDLKSKSLKPEVCVIKGADGRISSWVGRPHTFVVPSRVANAARIVINRPRMPV